MLALAALCYFAAPAFGQWNMQYGTGTDVFWQQTNGNTVPSGNPPVDGLWSDSANTNRADNWFSTYTVGSGGSAFLPGATNDVVFDGQQGLNGGVTDVRINVSSSIQGLYFNNVGPTGLTTDTNTDPQTITLGRDGITVESVVETNSNPAVGTTAVFVGETSVGSTPYSPLSLVLTGSQTWANYSPKYNLAVNSPISLAPSLTTGTTVLTLTTGGNNTYTSSNGTSGAVGNQASGGTMTDNTANGGVGALAIVAASGEWTLGAASTPPQASTYSGGVFIQPGAWVRDTLATDAGTGTVVVQNGGTFAPNTWESGSGGNESSNTNYANPIVISGVGVNAGITTNTTKTLGAIVGMNSGSGDNSDSDTLTGGVTLTGDALITAAFDPLIFTTNQINLNSYNLTLVGTASARKITISSPIVGSGNLIINSASGNVTTLSGNNTYAGTTTNTSGTLQIGSGGPTGSFGAGAITFGSGSALILDVSSNLTVNSPMTFASGVTIKQMGTGTTVLNNVTSYSAATTVSAGTLELNSFFGTPASGSVTVSSGASFALGPNYFSNSNVSGSTTPLNQFLLPAIANSSAGAVALSVNSSESINFSNTGTFAWSFANLSLGAVGSVTYSGTFTPNGTTYRFGGGGGTLTFASAISGSGSLLQTGAGTTILSGPNIFSGTTTLSAGNLEFNSYDSSLPPGSITVGAGTAVAAGPAFISGSPSGTLAGSFLPLIATSSAGTIALAADNSENLDFSNDVGGFNFTAASLGAIGAATYNGTLTPNGSTYRLGGGGGTLTFAGALTGANSLAVSSSGKVVLTNSGNNYSGGTTIGSGATLSINSDAEFGQVPSSPTTNIAINGGTLRTTGSFTLNTNRGISLGPTNGGGTIDVAPGTTLNYGGFISNASGSNSLTITDSGTLVLSGTNAYGGGTTVQGGATLSIDPSRGSVGSGTVTVNGGTLSLSKSNPLNNSLNVLGSSVIDVTGASSATVSGAVTLLGSTLQITGGSTGTNAPYSVALGTQGGSFSFGDGPSTIQLNSNGTGAASLTLGALTGGNGLPLITFSGTGTTTLGSASSMLPVDTQITVGPGGMVLNSNNSTAMGIFSLVTINSGSTLNLGASQTVSSLSGSGNVNLNGNTLTIGNVDGASGSLSGTVSGSSAAAIVVNYGSAALTGPNTYGGGTTVNSGTLNIGGSTTPAGTNSSISLAGGTLGLIGQGPTLSNPTQTYAYNVLVSANSGVNVSRSLTATLGNLTIGSNSLTVNSPDALGVPYSLTFAGNSGVTNLTGNPTFFVNNSASGGVGTLALSALKDNGTARTITFGGTGTVALNSAASSLFGGTQIVTQNALASSGPTAAPVSEYKFAEGSGTVANDSGSNNITGQLIGPGFGFTTTSQVGPYALNLTAANSYLQIPHSAADQLSAYTVSAWVNASSFSSGNPTIFSTRNGGDTAFDVQLLPSGIHGDVGSGTAWLDTNLNLSHPINPGTWYLVTYSVSSAGTNIYLNDGTAATGGATANYTPGVGVYTTGTPALENSSTFATIGNQEGGGNSFAATSQFLGQIDDVRIYNSALTAAQVAQLYALTPAGVTLNSNNATALGSNSQLTVGAGSTFNLGASQQVAVLSGAGAVTLGGNTLTIGTGNNDSSNSTFSGAISGTGGLTLNKSSTAMLALQNGTSTSSYSGPTMINGGTLAITVNPPAPTYVPLANGNLAAPNLGQAASSYGYSPAGTGNPPLLTAAQLAAAAWTFTNNAGLADVNSAFGPTSNPATGDGQFAFLQGNGGLAGSSISQTVTLAAGTYTVGLYAEGRGSGFGPNTVSVFLIPGNGNLNTATAGTLDLTPTPITPGSTTAFTQYSLTGTIPAGAGGVYTLDLIGGVVSSPSDLTSFIDDVTLSSPTVYSSQVLSPNSSVSLTTANSTLSLNDNSQTIGSLTGALHSTVELGALATTTLTIGADNSSPPAFAGTISGAGGLMKIGSGTLTLSGPNSYSGGTTVINGTLRVANGGNGSATGPGAVTIESGATLGVSTSSGSGTISPTGSNTVTILTGGALSGANGVTLTLKNGLTLQSGVTTTVNLSGTPSGVSGSNPMLAVTGGSLIAMSGAYTINLIGIPSGGTYDLINYTGANVSGSGTFQLGTAPSGFGYQLQLNTQINQLDLIVAASVTWTGVNSGGATNNSWDTTSASTNWAGGSPVAASRYVDGAPVTFADANPLTNANVTNTTVSIQTAGVQPYSVTFTNTGAAHGGVDYTIGDAGGTIGIAGPCGLTLNGNGVVGGTVTLAGANGFSGAVTVNFGQLVLANGQALGNTSAVTVASGAALGLQSGSGTSGSYGLTAAGSTPIATSLSGTGFAGTGALTSLNGIDTYAGAITLTGPTTIGSVSTSNSDGLTLSGGVNNNGNPLTFNGAGSTTVSTAPISGAGGLTQSGPGMLTLAATNTYFGPTAVNGGSLLVTGSLASGSAVTVGGAGASGKPTLSGSGTINGPVTVSAIGGGAAGHLAPSGVASTFTTTTFTNGLTLASGTSALAADGPQLDFNITSFSGSDLIDVTGGMLSPGAYDIVNINPFGGGAGLNPGNYPLIDFGLISGDTNLSMWTVGSHAGDNAHTYSFIISTGTGTGGGNQIDLVVSGGGGSGEWIADSSNGGTLNYSRGLNWSNGTVPNGVGEFATFGTGNKTNVNIDGSNTVGLLNFTSGSGYSLASTSASNGFTLNNGPSTDAQVNVADGSAADFLYTQVNLASSTGNTTITIQPGSSLFVSAFNTFSTNVGLSGSGQGLTLAGGGTLELAATNTYTGPTKVNSGTLLIDAGASIRSTSIVVGVGGSLQLAGTTNALPAAANITTQGTGTATDGAVSLTGAATESIGTISSMGTTNGDGATVYAGNTTVGDGSSAASLTATRILQNTLTINANSTVTIAPTAGSVGGVVAAASSASVAASNVLADSNGGSSSDLFTAIQDAIAAGSISSATGQRLENRIAAIERLAATDPGLDVSLLESRVLAALPSSSVLPSTDGLPLADTGSVLLAADSDTFGSSSTGASATFASGVGFSGSPVAVPEPSSLLLAALGGIGLALANRRRRTIVWSLSE